MPDVHSRPPTARVDIRIGSRRYGGQYSVIEGRLVVTCDGGQSAAIFLGDSAPEQLAAKLLRQLVERRLGRAS